MMRLESGLRKSRVVVFGVVLVCVFCTGTFGQPWAGSGTEGDPYQIWTAADMQAIGGSGYMGAHFELMADIDLSAYTGTSFNIIGNSTTKFTGVFDGNGHTLSNFTYSSTGTNCIGVFGEIRRATIKDLGLINPNVDAGTGLWVGGLVGQVLQGKISGCISNCYAEGGSVSGGDNVGGLVGRIYLWPSSITNCYSTASVSGTTNVGGLVGYNGQDCTVTNCYSEGSVSGDANVGGLVGKNEREVIKCYSVGSVSGSSNVGGLVGDGSPVCASFWDAQTSGQPTNGGGTPKTTAEMQTADTFFGWGGCGSEGVWVLDEGNDYPRLWWENKPGQPLPTESLSDFVAGDGTEQDPYLIETGEQMNMVGVFWCEWGKHFKLTADIDLSAYTGTSFNIIGIGHYEYTFRGTFDGNGHTISNFSYDSNNTDCIGLFGRGGGIKDLGLINPIVDAGTGNSVGSLIGSGSATGCYVEGGSVAGGVYVGGLVGGGGVVNCTSSASVSGTTSVGGLVGSGEASNCTSSASVSGTTSVGGLVGSSIGAWNARKRITNCYSAGSVSGVSEVGGLVGRHESVEHGLAEVTNCYSTASVTGIFYLGGLVGRNVEQVGFDGVAAVTNCYSAGGVSGTTNVGGLVGWNGGNGAVVIHCYSTGGVSGVSVVGGLVGYNESGAITDSFWDTETSDQTTSAGGIGMPTAQMQSAFIFTVAGWDFVGESANGTDDFWDICEGTNYPKLAWQVPVLGDFGCPDGVDGIDLGVLCEGWLLEELSWDVWPNGGDGFVDFFDWAIFADGWGVTVDYDDLADFAGQWLKSGSNYVITDIAPGSDGDGITNGVDFAALADNWLAGI